MKRMQIEKRSRLAPTNMQSRDTYYIIGEKFVRNLVCTQLPEEYTEGFLAPYVSDPSIKVYMKTFKSNQHLATFMKKDYLQKQQDWRKTTDIVRQRTLEQEMTNIDIQIQENLRNNDRTHNVLIVFSVFADDLEELKSKSRALKDRLYALGVKTEALYSMQTEIFRLMNPLFIDCGLPPEIKENITIPISSKSVAGMYPFIFETMKDRYGTLLGSEMTNGGIVILDQFKYINEPELSVVQQRMNGNMMVIGKTGSGKTTTMNLFVRSYIRRGIKFVWIDPDDKNKRMTKKYGGTFIQWGTRNAMINVFDLKPVSCEEDENVDPYDTELAIYNVIDDIKVIFRYLYPTISDDTLAMVGDIVIRTYESKGIGFETRFKGMEASLFPIFSDFEKERLKMLEEFNKEGASRRYECECLSDLGIKMKPILNEYKIYFNGHTSIKDASDESYHGIISFGTKLLESKPAPLKNALTHIMMQYAWSLCLDQSEDTAFVLDEAHTMILEPVRAKLLAKFSRQSRKYHNVTVFGTQEARDFSDEAILTSGKAIFNSAVYKIVMTLDLDAVNDLKKLVPINDNEGSLIQRFQRGQCLLVSGSQRMCVKILVTDAELDDMGR